MSAIDFQKMLREERRIARAARALTLARAQPAEPEAEPEPEPEAVQQQQQQQQQEQQEQAGCCEPCWAAAALDSLRPLNLAAYRCKGDSAPRSVFYIPEFVTEEQALSLFRAVAADSGSWVQLRRRRLQCHGGTVLPEGTVAEPLPPHLRRVCELLQHRHVFPPPRLVLGSSGGSSGSSSSSSAAPAGGDGDGGSLLLAPNHVLVNEYAPGEGIMPHCDGPLYHPAVAILTLNSHTVFDFWPSAAAAAAPGTPPARSLLLQPRSLLLFGADAYTDYLHGIEGRLVDHVGGGDHRELAGKGGVLGEMGSTAAADTSSRLPVVLERGTRVSLTVRHVLNMRPRQPSEEE
jgi:alkylated DNA repair protein alkB family protein 6